MKRPSIRSCERPELNRLWASSVIYKHIKLTLGKVTVVTKRERVCATYKAFNETPCGTDHRVDEWRNKRPIVV